MTRQNHAVSLLQATQGTPTLARLMDLAQESTQRLDSVRPLIPSALRASVKAGPIEGLVWCLILDNSATAAKIRQLLPALESHLRSKGWPIDSIRLKVQAAASR